MHEIALHYIEIKRHNLWKYSDISSAGRPRFLFYFILYRFDTLFLFVFRAKSCLTNDTCY